MQFALLRVPLRQKLPSYESIGRKTRRIDWQICVALKGSSSTLKIRAWCSRWTSIEWSGRETTKSTSWHFVLIPAVIVLFLTDGIAPPFLSQKPQLHLGKSIFPLVMELHRQ